MSFDTYSLCVCILLGEGWLRKKITVHFWEKWMPLMQNFHIFHWKRGDHFYFRLMNRSCYSPSHLPPPPPTYIPFPFWAPGLVTSDVARSGNLESIHCLRIQQFFLVDVMTGPFLHIPFSSNLPLKWFVWIWVVWLLKNQEPLQKKTLSYILGVSTFSSFMTIWLLIPSFLICLYAH